ncbi:hypothetical protein DENSPDRAFT_871026 [Dentipellis sp. KUC8613]|nr:hypothetical protein DENSPDRAFT_871026 [Dentipellis sp. KUC8613]
MLCKKMAADVRELKQMGYNKLRKLATGDRAITKKTASKVRSALLQQSCPGSVRVLALKSMRGRDIPRPGTRRATTVPPPSQPTETRRKVSEAEVLAFLEATLGTKCPYPQTPAPQEQPVIQQPRAVYPTTVALLQMRRHMLNSMSTMEPGLSRKRAHEEEEPTRGPQPDRDARSVRPIPQRTKRMRIIAVDSETPMKRERDPVVENLATRLATLSIEDRGTSSIDDVVARTQALSLEASHASALATPAAAAYPATPSRAPSRRAATRAQRTPPRAAAEDDVGPSPAKRVRFEPAPVPVKAKTRTLPPRTAREAANRKWRQ